MLSVIIAHHNQNQALPQALDSILAQGISSLEVVLVDDYSTESCLPVVEEYRQKGLSITLLENPVRLYTAKTRIAGLEAAKGDVLTFLDADDCFYETGLAEAVRLMEREKPDILHFGFLQTENNGSGLARCYMPDAALLSGNDIFAHYCLHGAPAHMVWGKLYAHSLIQRSLPVAKTIEVHRYREDLFLYTIFAFLAKTYLGVKIPVYLYRLRADSTLKNKKKSLGRLVTTFQMKSRLLPYFQEQGCMPESLNALADILQTFTLDSLEEYAGYLQSLEDPNAVRQELLENLNVLPAELYLESILLSLPVGKHLCTEKA